MFTALALIGALVVIGFLIRACAQGIRTSGLKRVGWFAEFHDDEKSAKQLKK
jgi:hypothetical protein